MLKNNSALQEAVSPVLDSGLSLKDHRIILGEMFANSVSNPPDGDIDGFAAKRQSPVYLALMALLENLEEVEK